MNEEINWADLRAAFCDDRPDAEGPDGFEGLLTALFSAETGERFYLARRGDQPVGDACRLAAGTILQAKRYRDSSINANNVEGEISHVLREAPALDVFVVAAIRTDAQLRTRLVRKGQETGLDVVFLELSESLPDLEHSASNIGQPRGDSCFDQTPGWTLGGPQTGAPETLNTHQRSAGKRVGG